MRSRSVNRKAGARRRPVSQQEQQAPPSNAKKRKQDFIDDPEALQILRELLIPNDLLKSGKLLSWALSPEDDSFVNIQNYVNNGQEDDFQLKILSILRIVSKPSNFQDVTRDEELKWKHRKMLWHGTNANFIPQILENGFQIPADKGQAFGTGIYFADRISKSVHYSKPITLAHAPEGVSWGEWCDQYSTEKFWNWRYLLLCDVLVGESHELCDADRSLTAPPNGCDSVQGVGLNIPDPEGDKTIDGCTWPLGPTVNRTPILTKKILKVNEYIVYDPKLVRPQYLVKIEVPVRRQKPILQM